MVPLNLPLRDMLVFGAELSYEQISDLAQYLRARFADRAVEICNLYYQYLSGLSPVDIVYFSNTSKKSHGK